MGGERSVMIVEKGFLNIVPEKNQLIRATERTFVSDSLITVKRVER